MKPHHRASLLLACLGLFVLYLPEGLRLASDWPARPGLARVPRLASGPTSVDPGPTAGLIAPLLPTSLTARPTGTFPAPVGPAEPLVVDDLAIDGRSESYSGGQ
ncbi:MAG: hypothetical protein O2816_11860 [Planctomycetota bacterium]|nr:hypothetical protein [Planctomycetota bacterium]